MLSRVISLKGIFLFCASKNGHMTTLYFSTLVVDLYVVLSSFLPLSKRNSTRFPVRSHDSCVIVLAHLVQQIELH